MRHTILFSLFLMIILSEGCQPSGQIAGNRPNIIYILADDLGIGDVSAYNPQSKIITTAIDAIARNGLLFSDAHSGSSVCTPTRYGILTGRYAWRTRLAEGVSWTYDTHLIDPERLTVASYLKEHGYQTACIGKWHLGLDWGKNADGAFDFTLPIQNGPNQNGFDYFFGITASLDIPPYFYIENDLITAHSIDTIEAMEGKKFWRRSAIGNDFVHEEVLPVLTEKALQYIDEKSQEKAPFFLYFPLTAPHTPILPTPDFLAKSGTNEYGDFVLMVDDVVRQIVDAVKKAGIQENTMIIFTSDNGCSPMADFAELEAAGHDPSYIYRGHKADIYEGGHRIPFIVQWPGKIQTRSTSDQIICLTDLLATVAGIVGTPIPPGAGEDSYDLTPLFTDPGMSTPVREATVHHSIHGCFSIRQSDWKICFCPGSGGWSYPTPKEAAGMNLPPVQLFNLRDDPAEEKNIADAHPDVVRQLSTLMQKYVDEGRSTPGEKQPNDREISFVN